MAVWIFFAFVIFVLFLSFYLGSKARSASGYFAAGGQIHWGVNGIAFAGDYLSAASFLGICGMIATAGYDGYLYSIGYLSGWVVALFVVAEPMKKLGKYTFTDALDSKFNSPGIQLAAGISTLVVSLCYLIPQMVGAGVLVEPLLGMDHHWGVIMVGAIVIFIVATAGMASTTYVQFLKGGLLIIFSVVLAVAMCSRGLSTTPQGTDKDGNPQKFYEYQTIEAGIDKLPGKLNELGYRIIGQNTIRDAKSGETKMTFVKLAKLVPLVERDNAHFLTVKGREVQLVRDSRGLLAKLIKQESAEKFVINGVPHIYEERDGRKWLTLYEGKSTDIDGIRVVESEDGKLLANVVSWWKKENGGDTLRLHECQSVVVRPSGGVMVNGAPFSDDNQLRTVGSLSKIKGKTGPEADTGSLGPVEFLATIADDETVVERWKAQKFDDGESQVTAYYASSTPGGRMMRPGLKFKVEGSSTDRLNFVSLMLALFFGTAALPHILIRYYTVPSPAAARKSTIVAIAAIGFFYILTMYLGLGAAVNSAVNPETSNMSAPLLARVFSETLFAFISAIAFATVLGTVSGLIVAASGAVAHDLLDRFCNLNMSDKQKVGVGKLAAFAVGLVAIILGIVFKGMNVSFLVGWAFAVAASANLPAIIMILFWKKTTAKGIVASIIVGMVSALGIILVSPSMYQRYGLPAEQALTTIDQPGIISIPLSFITLVVVSLLTQKNGKTTQES